jgi:hypothetical protein
MKRVLMFLALGSIFVLLGLLSFSLTQQDKGVRSSDVTARSKRSAERGIKWLLKIQHRNGAWGCEKGSPPDICITSLAALALMSKGDTPNRGKNARAIKKALYFVLQTAERRRFGHITTGQCAATRMGMGSFLDHACATIFLSQIYGQVGDKQIEQRIRRVLRKAVVTIEKAQNRDGGWGGEIGRRQSLLSVTAMAWLALRSAHSSGTTIKYASCEKSVRFAKRSYKRAPQSGGRFLALASALRILYGMGKRNIPQAKRATRQMFGMNLGTDFGGRISEWCYLAAFLGTQALSHSRYTENKRWKRWFRKIRRKLIRIQNADGSWTMDYCYVCRAFATALAVLTLEIPYWLLPLVDH